MVSRSETAFWSCRSASFTFGAILRRPLCFSPFLPCSRHHSTLSFILLIFDGLYNKVFPPQYYSSSYLFKQCRVMLFHIFQEVFSGLVDSMNLFWLYLVQVLDKLLHFSQISFFKHKQ